jgi:ATPases involved in chromosome partitioning
VSTDKAFDNLMHKKALAIPIAQRNDSPEEGFRRRDSRDDLDEETLQVNLVDDRPGDYHPRGDTHHDSERGVYNRQTETDLEPVEVDDTRRHTGSQRIRMVGRDASHHDAYLDDEMEQYTEAAEVESGENQGLECARRVQRFAYLPLAGMEAFESQARDMATQLASANPDAASLAITSPTRGVGRTELAIRLALAIAKRVGHRVLLADMDVRKPAIAARLGLSTKYFTTTDVLRGSCQLGEALVASIEDDLYVLPARTIDRDGDEVLDRRQVEAMLLDMHQTFDFVIIDCGPAAQADAIVVSRHAGAVAIAGRCNMTSAPAMRQAAHNLSAVGAKIAGMFVIGA